MHLKSKNAAGVATTNDIQELDFQADLNTKKRNLAICELYSLIKNDPQARRFLAALLEELEAMA